MSDEHPGHNTWSMRCRWSRTTWDDRYGSCPLCADLFDLTSKPEPKQAEEQTQ